MQSSLLGQLPQDHKAVALMKITQKRGTPVFKTRVKHQQAGDDSTSSKSPKTLDVKKLRGEKVQSIDALLRELLGTYDVYLLTLHDESLNPRGNHSLSCTMLDNKKQMLWWSLRAAKPTRVTTSGPQSSCAYDDNLQERDTCV